MPEPPTTPAPPPPDPSPSTSSHWSESFVEHLRTVHFALSILAVAIIFTLLSGKEYDAQKAWSQATEIREFSENWDKNMSQLFDAMASAAGQGQSLPANVEVFSSSTSLTDLTTFNLTKAGAMLEAKWLAFTIPENRPTSVASFRSWWNRLNKGVDIPMPSIDFSLDEKPTRCLSLDPDERREGNLLIQSRRMDDCTISFGRKLNKNSNGVLESLDCSASNSSSNQPSSTVCDFYIRGPREYFEFQTKGIVSHLDGDTIVKNLYGDWVAGKFEEAFPDLAKAVYPNLEYVDLKSLPDRLNEGSKSDQVIEAFGLKIAATDVTRWGLLILLATQFYFWLHLHELSERIQPTDPGWSVAWIGIYQPWLAFITVVVSACVLPFVAACLASYRLRFEGYPTLQEETAIVAILASALLAASTWLKLYELRGGSAAAAAPRIYEPIPPSEPTI